jgi:hypothetical protein
MGAQTPKPACAKAGCDAAITKAMIIVNQPTLEEIPDRVHDSTWLDRPLHGFQAIRGYTPGIVVRFEA